VSAPRRLFGGRARWPAIVGAIGEVAATLRQDFMRLTMIRVVVATLVVVLCSYLSVGRTKSYYSDFVMPPSFRHMDPTILHPVISDYLDGQRASGDTLLVLGDCIAFGHGVTESFSRFLKIPDVRIVNVSMQTFRYDLMILTIKEAARRGVKRVLIQLHPFEDYGFEARLWEALTVRHPVSLAERAELSQPDFVQQAAANWRLLATALKSGRLSFHEVPPYDLALAFSSFLRYDVLSGWSLYRNRFAIDDWLGLKLSFYTARTQRSDSFVERFPEQRQIQILAEQSWLWPKFVIADRAQYRERALQFSAPVRLARTMKDLGMNATFFMAPTLVDLIGKHTVIPPSDLMFVSQTMKEAVTAYGFRYIDFLENVELERNMIHYDNLTADGQKLLGRLLNEQLAEKTADMSRTRRSGRM
jgi:hypothetical protein